MLIGLLGWPSLVDCLLWVVWGKFWSDICFPSLIPGAKEGSSGYRRQYRKETSFKGGSIEEVVLKEVVLISMKDTLFLTDSTQMQACLFSH